VAQQCNEHLRLLDLIEAGKHERAAEYLESHLDFARKTKAMLVRGSAKAAK
jgi:DNA-binding GntR family transcriptional regulator